MKQVIDWFKGLSSGMKLLVLVGAFLLLWWAYNKVKARFGASAQDIQAKTEIQILTEKGVKQSYSNDTYKHWADKLETAMLGMGTDVTTVVNIFNMLKNDMDFIKLDSAFGVRDFADNLFGLSPATNMRGWMKDESKLTSVIPVINQSLKAKGITKRI